MTRDEYFTGIFERCENCKHGISVRYRTETNEWVHDSGYGRGGQYIHSLCGAHQFRLEHPEYSKNG